MRLTIVTSTILLLAVSPESIAEPPPTEFADYTVAQLLEPCMEGDNDSRWGAAAEAECEQYIIGFVDAYLLSDLSERDKVCLPPQNNRADEVRWAFMKWAHKNYEKRNMPAALGLAETIKVRFACK